MSNAQQFFMFIGIMTCIVAALSLFMYVLIVLHTLTVKSTVGKDKMTDETLIKLYNDKKKHLDNKSIIIITSITMGIFIGGGVGGFIYYFFIKKLFTDSYEIYKNAMIQRNLPL
ncbi:hypothetical protein FPQ14_09460 [Gilliamella apicola]|uniref:Uncharacterized protein n=1 Tax=Gilliamella apicola TaxID=1196095 RepID=A0A556RIR8_9GAMM|nr:hypothetical protein [Gilliamella apicola]TSJ88788.1 hypothetical protein FPQ14_09460 [Gilliamella apicola]